jgi:hypothetical protein
LYGIKEMKRENEREETGKRKALPPSLRRLKRRKGRNGKGVVLLLVSAWSG